MNWAALMVLVLSVPAFGVMFFHAVGPAVFILASTPFDAIPWVLLGPSANLITVLPVLVMLVRTSPSRWMGLFLGTRLQQVMATFVIALLVSHGLSADEFGFAVVSEYARKVALFLIAGVLIHSMGTSRNMMSCVRALVMGMAAFAILSILEFYFGLHLLPMASYWGSEGAIGSVWNESTANDFRLRGAGDAVSVNRFANWMLLPMFLSMGWFSVARTTREKFVAFACFASVSIGLLGTISRSAFAGVAGALLVFLPITFRRRPIHGLGLMAIGVIAAGALALLARLFGLDDLILFRFSAGELAGSGREARWSIALHFFEMSPILGIGVGNYATYAGRVMGDSHNAFLNLLVEAGLLGLIPQLILLAYVLQRLARRPRGRNDIYAWRPYFLGAFIALLISNLFNSYAFERVLWFAMVYAGVLELAERRERGAVSAAARPLSDPDQPIGGIQAAFGSQLARHRDV